MNMRGFLKLILRVMPCAECERSVVRSGKFKTVAVFVGYFDIADVNSVAVFLRTHIVVLKVVNAHLVNSYFAAGFTVDICFLWTSAVPLYVVEFGYKPHLRTESQKCKGLWSTLVVDLDFAVGIDNIFRFNARE